MDIFIYHHHHHTHTPCILYYSFWPDIIDGQACVGQEKGTGQDGMGCPRDSSSWMFDRPGLACFCISVIRGGGGYFALASLTHTAGADDTMGGRPRRLRCAFFIYLPDLT